MQLQERERLIALQTGGLNHQELSLIHHQSRLHEDTLRRAAAERQAGLASGLSGLPGVGSLGDPLNSGLIRYERLRLFLNSITLI